MPPRRRRRSLALVLTTALALALAACNPTPPEGTGGTDVEPGPFGRGIVTVNVDFQSTNVSLVALDGARLSESFISSTSLLTGDVTAPTMPGVGDDIVLLDRGSGVVTWVDVRTAEIRAQLHSDDDQLARNPWDYLPVAPDKAYVTRYDPWPGNALHGDVIIIDPTTATELTTIDRRIDIAAALPLGGDLRVHPARGLVVGDRAYITTVLATDAYAEYGTSYLVAMSTTTDEITDIRELEDLHDCTSIALSPSRDELAITCSGDLYANELLAQDHSAIVFLSLEDLTETNRIPASALGPGPAGFSLSYASDRALLATTFGEAAGDTDDRAYWIDLDTKDTREIHRAAPVAIGAVLCPARLDGATDPASLTPPACFLTDAEQGHLLRYPIESGALGSPRSIVVDEVIGLPPRYLGQF